MKTNCDHFVFLQYEAINIWGGGGIFAFSYVDVQPFCQRDIVIIHFKLHLLSHPAIIVGSILVCVLSAVQHSTQKRTVG